VEDASGGFLPGAFSVLDCHADMKLALRELLMNAMTKA
jgi:hypothetical protein